MGRRRGRGNKQGGGHAGARGNQAPTQQRSMECTICWESTTDWRLLTCCSGICCTQCLRNWLTVRVQGANDERKGTCPRCQNNLGPEHQDLVSLVDAKREADVAELREQNGFKWRGHTRSEVLTQLWRLAFTNRCPRCWRPIIRDGGCPSMVCPSPCNRSFVWSNPLAWMLNLGLFLLFLFWASRLDSGEETGVMATICCMA